MTATREKSEAQGVESLKVGDHCFDPTGREPTRTKMMHSVVHAEPNSSSDDSATDLFSPVYGRRHSLHPFDTPETPAADGSDTLPRLADNSWIGAQVSPIPSVDEGDVEDDLELDRVTAPYHKAMRDFGANERSALLGRSIHPMWGTNEVGNRNGNGITDRSSASKRRRPPPIWGRVLVGASGMHLFLIGLHDSYFWYLRVRRGVEPQYPLAWSLPWLRPSARILLRFGAYCSSKIILQRQWYRVVTSWFISASVVEWVMVAVAWWQMEKLAASTRVPHNTSNWMIWWPFFFIVSIGTGQLWMAAFGATGALSGCVGWGTCGVLCAMGVSCPDHRLPLFLTTIALVLVNLLQYRSSVFGAIGASFFGWSFYGVGLLSPDSSVYIKDNNSSGRRWHCLNWLALVTLLKLWIIPILFIAFWTERQTDVDFYDTED